ncbi:SpoVG family protein [Planctomycetota bacterium]
MEITEVRVKLVENEDDRLKAFCSVTLDNEFVVRDIKIIEGGGGHFVAMPSRKMSDHCERCGGKTTYGPDSVITVGPPSAKTGPKRILRAV